MASTRVLEAKPEVKAEETASLLKKESPKKKSSLQSGKIEWLGAKDEKEREDFLIKLSRQRLPCPQCEGDWHAARVYVDSLHKAIYDLEQWCDYLSLKNKLPITSEDVSEAVTPPSQKKNSRLRRSKSATSRTTQRRAFKPSSQTSTPKPPPPRTKPPPLMPMTNESKAMAVVSQLIDMGFNDVEQVQAVVVACNADFQSSLNLLLNAKARSPMSAGTASPATPGSVRFDSKQKQIRPTPPNYPRPTRSQSFTELVLVRCGSCKAQLKIHSHSKEFVCGVCGARNRVLGLSKRSPRTSISKKKQCPSCTRWLRYDPSNAHIKCPICSVVIDTLKWTVFTNRPNSKPVTTQPKSIPSPKSQTSDAKKDSIIHSTEDKNLDTKQKLEVTTKTKMSNEGDAAADKRENAETNDSKANGFSTETDVKITSIKVEDDDTQVSDQGIGSV